MGITITTLGTSYGNPTITRFNSSNLIETRGKLYLVDAGEPVTALMVRAGKDFENLKGVFITHMHADHVGGLPSLIKMMLKYPTDTRYIEVVLPEKGAVPPLTEWLTAQHMQWPSEMVSLKTAEPGVVFQDAVVTVHALQIGHLQRNGRSVSFAYAFVSEAKRIVFTGDISKDFSDFPVRHGEGEKHLKKFINQLPYPAEIAHDGSEYIVNK